MTYWQPEPGPQPPADQESDQVETELPTMDDLDSLSAELDEIDATLARMDAAPPDEPH